MLSLRRLVLVPCELSMSQEVGVCMLSMLFIAPYTHLPYNRQVLQGCIDRADHMLSSVNDRYLRNV